VSDPLAPSADSLAPQHEIELPNGVVVAGMGGDPELIQEQIEDRQEERKTGLTKAPETPAQQKEAGIESGKSRRRLAQERIDEAIGKQKEADRRAEAAEARYRELEQRMSAKPTESVKAEPAKAVEPTRPKPTEEEVGTKYQSYADFVEDLADWKVEQREAKTNLKQVIDATVAERIEADRASRSFMDTATAMVERGRKVFADFDAVKQNGPGSQVNLGPEKNAAILRLPNSERVIYEACKSAEVANELLAITDPIEFGMRLARFSTEEPAAKAAPASPKVPMTNAAPPVQPVGTSSRTTQPSLEELAGHAMDDYDNSGYRERRKAELAAARR